MKLRGVKVGELFGAIGSASVMIGKIHRYDWARFAGEGKRFVRVRGWPQNPPIIDHASSSLAPGTPLSLKGLGTRLKALSPIGRFAVGEYYGEVGAK